jgi:hypothetical protein
MNNKIKWVREENNTAVPYIFEQGPSGHFVWRRYNTAKCYVPDCGNFSKGFATFKNAIKLKYELVEGVSSSVGL